MSVLEKLACRQGRKDEVPNQELARALAARADRKGIQEIAENLWSQDKNVQFDCVKVLYEIGYIKPDLIAGYVADFLKLLSNRQNRLVWGAMLALSTIATIKSREIFASVDKVMKAMESGSVITVDNGVQVLARVASTDAAYSKRIFPFLIEHLQTCRPKEVAQHAESTLCAVNAKNKQKYIDVLNERVGMLAPSQAARIKKVFQVLEKI